MPRTHVSFGEDGLKAIRRLGVNDVVHSVMPIVVVVDWLLDPPRQRLTNRQALSWIVVPAIWLAYTLVKGPIVEKYPYPFLDPATGGYGSVAVYVVAILVVMALVAMAAVWVANAANEREPVRVS